MDERIATLIAHVMDNAVDEVMTDYSQGDIGDEDDLTSQFIGRLKSSVNGLQTGGVVWSAVACMPEMGEGLASDKEKVQAARVKLRGRHLSSKGPGAEEKKYGADMVLVLDADLPDAKISKGILIQTKMVNSDSAPVSESESKRLVSQCEAMLKITPASYVFTCSKNELNIYSATSIKASQAKHIKNIFHWSNGNFFFDFLICWIGDPNISATDKASLAALQASVDARSAMLLTARRT